MNTRIEKKQTWNRKAALAKSITRKGSKQTYYTTRLLVDKDLADDCYRAYAYFRWADDVVDAVDKTALTPDKRTAFINRQRSLMDQCYKGQAPQDLTAEEKILADLIKNDRRDNRGLESFIRNFHKILEFDAGRRDRFISQRELIWYSNCLTRAVTDGIHYFIGNHHSYVKRDDRYQAVFAAHVVHMLRDMITDTEEGYINIPGDFIKKHRITLGEVTDPNFRAWVHDRVELARSHLQTGKQYLDGLEVLRAKIAGYWYCARYEVILDAIERDGYLLRREYKRSATTWFRIAWLGVSVTFKHYVRQLRQGFWGQTPAADPQTAVANHQKGA